ncbi:ankyrin repeat-containing domain protein [Mycena haematopus]|nr:ankyrin repeat-containing domain protein [Mycena haematopus]
MAVFSDLPPELLLHITVSFLTRETKLDPLYCLKEYIPRGPELVPDLPSINALCQTSGVSHRTLDQTLYNLCASVDALGKLALLFAVQHELESTVDRLVAAGASLDGQFTLKYCLGGLLHIAASLGLRSMVVKLLGMYGEQMTTRVYAPSPTPSRWTPLHCAANFGHTEIVRLLAPIPIPQPAISPFLSRTHYLSVALNVAVRAGHMEISRYLISEGADVNFFDREFVGGTALSDAVSAKDPALALFLLASGADPNLHNHDAVIPLFTAVRRQNMAIVRALVDSGANIHVQSHGLHNVLSHCTSIELLRFFLERGVDPNSESTGGTTALHDACTMKERSRLGMRGLLLNSFVSSEQHQTKPTERRNTCRFGNEERIIDLVEILEPLVQGPDLRLKIAAWWREREEPTKP